MAIKKQKIKYTKGIKYQLFETYRARTSIRPPRNVKHELVELRKTGLLIIYKYFCWDGPSGPTRDSRSNMRGSLEHDAFMVLFRNRKLARKWLPAVNKRFHRVLLTDGMNRVRARMYYAGGSLGARSASKYKNRRKVYTAP